MANETILIVGNKDALDMTHQLLALVFRSKGCVALVANDAAEGLIFAETTPPDLVIIIDDISVNHTYKDIIKNLRTDPLISQIPIIFYTASTKIDEAETLKMGIDAFFNMPLDLHKMITSVETLLSQKLNTLP